MLKRTSIALSLLLWTACTQSHGGADDVERDAGTDLMDHMDLSRPQMDLASPALSLNRVTPPVGPPAGGIALLLDGQGFQSGAVVSVDGKSAAPIQFMSPQQLGATLPQNLDAFGAVPVTVTLPGGASVTRNDLFAYGAQRLLFDSKPFLGATNPAALAVGDFDGDGQDDFAVATNYVTPRVLVCMNDGTKVCARAATASYIGLPIGLALGDCNGDGKNDIVVSTAESVPPSERQFFTFLNDGKGGLLAPVQTRLSENASRLVVANLNGDKYLDMVATCDGGNVCVYKGDGTGKFASGAKFYAGPVTTAAVADLDGDGKQDLALANSGSSNILLEFGDGMGSFSSQRMVAVKYGASSISVGDLDRDGVLDLVTSHKDSGVVSRLRGTGGGNFAAPFELTVGGAPDYVRLADFNGDLHLDIALADLPAQTISVLLSDGKGGFAAPSVQPGGHGPVSLTIGDFDRDRRPDLLAIALGSMSELTLLFNHSR